VKENKKAGKGLPENRAREYGLRVEGFSGLIYSLVVYFQWCS
jgi:hypothetical protein